MIRLKSNINSLLKSESFEFTKNKSYKAFEQNFK